MWGTKVRGELKHEGEVVFTGQAEVEIGEFQAKGIALKKVAQTGS